jgi:molecular chaperone IbpA
MIQSASTMPKVAPEIFAFTPDSIAGARSAILDGRAEILAKRRIDTLEIKMPFPKSLAVEAHTGSTNNGRRAVSGVLVSMLLTQMEDVAMRSLNLDPFWRTSIGFDRLFDLMDESLRFEPEDHYPPCNIVRTGEDSYRISLAVAGFKPEQITVTVHQNMLTVSGRVNEKQKENEGESEYLYRGIAGRPFERRFNLADFVEVNGASFEDGLLQIELQREVPEAMKPRRIEIQAGKSSTDNVKAIEHSKVA